MAAAGEDRDAGPCRGSSLHNACRCWEKGKFSSDWLGHPLPADGLARRLVHRSALDDHFAYRMAAQPPTQRRES